MKYNPANTQIPPSIKKVAVQDVKALWSFDFLSWLLTYVFITIFAVNGCVYILKTVLDIMEKLTHVSQNVCGCLALNEMYIKLPYLKVGSINCNLANTSLTTPPEVKRTVLHKVNIIILSTWKETSIYWKFKDEEIYNLF